MQNRPIAVTDKKYMWLTANGQAFVIKPEWDGSSRIYYSMIYNINEEMQLHEAQELKSDVDPEIDFTLSSLEKDKVIIKTGKRHSRYNEIQPTETMMSFSNHDNKIKMTCTVRSGSNKNVTTPQLILLANQKLQIPKQRVDLESKNVTFYNEHNGKWIEDVVVKLPHSNTPFNRLLELSPYEILLVGSKPNSDIQSFCILQRLEKKFGEVWETKTTQQLKIQQKNIIFGSQLLACSYINSCPRIFLLDFSSKTMQQTSPNEIYQIHDAAFNSKNGKINIVCGSGYEYYIRSFEWTEELTREIYDNKTGKYEEKVIVPVIRPLVTTELKKHLPTDVANLVLQYHDADFKVEALKPSLSISQSNCALFKAQQDTLIEIMHLENLNKAFNGQIYSKKSTYQKLEQKYIQEIKNAFDKQLSMNKKKRNDGIEPFKLMLGHLISVAETIQNQSNITFSYSNYFMVLDKHLMEIIRQFEGAEKTKEVLVNYYHKFKP